MFNFLRLNVFAREDILGYVHCAMVAKILEAYGSGNPGATCLEFGYGFFCGNLCVCLIARIGVFFLVARCKDAHPGRFRRAGFAWNQVVDYDLNYNVKTRLQK